MAAVTINRTCKIKQTYNAYKKKSYFPPPNELDFFTFYEYGSTCITYVAGFAKIFWVVIIFKEKMQNTLICNRRCSNYF